MHESIHESSQKWLTYQPESFYKFLIKEKKRKECIRCLLLKNTNFFCSTICSTRNLLFICSSQLATCCLFVQLATRCLFVQLSTRNSLFICSTRNSLFICSTRCLFVYLFNLQLVTRTRCFGKNNSQLVVYLSNSQLATRNSQLVV